MSNSIQMASNILAEEAGKKPVVTEEKSTFHHLPSANLVIKIINAGIKDKLIRDVMTRRLMSPIMTGKPRTHLSIAIELGADVEEVIYAEQVGIKLMDKLLEEAPEHMARFNSEKVIAEEVKRIGNSAR